MDFKQASPHLGLPIARMESDRWEMGVHPVIPGFRVRAGIINGPTVSIDYCAAMELDFLPVLYLVMYRIMRSLPADISARAVEDMMPRYRDRPIVNDPCWPALVKLAATSPRLEEEETNQAIAWFGSELKRWLIQLRDNPDTSQRVLRDLRMGAGALL